MNRHGWNCTCTELLALFLVGFGKTCDNSGCLFVWQGMIRAGFIGGFFFEQDVFAWQSSIRIGFTGGIITEHGVY